MMAVGANRKTAGFASAGHENHVVAGGRCIQHALFTSLGRKSWAPDSKSLTVKGIGFRV